MHDRQKVLKGLEVCVNRVPGKYDCYKCPYEIDENDCEINLTKDAIALLKEQEERIKQLEATSVIHNVSFTQIGENNKQIVNNGPMTMTFGK